MKFNSEHMKDQTNLFWDAYFQALELLDNDRVKFVEEVPIVREIPITDNFIFRIGRNRSKWELIYSPLDRSSEFICTWTVNQLNDANRAFELLSYFLECQVSDYYINFAY